jgi:hypothetical protein
VRPRVLNSSLRNAAVFYRSPAATAPGPGVLGRAETTWLTPGQVTTRRRLPPGWRAGRSRHDDGDGPARDGQPAGDGPRPHDLGIAGQADQDHQADRVPSPPITLAATSMPITEIPARDTASASPMDATRTASKPPGPADPLRQPAAPAKVRADHVSGGRHQHGKGDHRRGDETGGEQASGRRTGQRAQRPDGVLGGGDRLVMPAERRRGGDEHAPQDHGGEHGAGGGASPGPRQPAVGPPARSHA